MICDSGYDLAICAAPDKKRIEQARWLIPHLQKATKTKSCLFHIADIRQNLGLDTVLLSSLKGKIKHYGYHSKGAIAMMLVECGFSYEVDEYGAMLFNLSKKTRLQDV